MGDAAAPTRRSAFIIESTLKPSRARFRQPAAAKKRKNLLSFGRQKRVVRLVTTPPQTLLTHVTRPPTRQAWPSLLAIRLPLVCPHWLGWFAQHSKNGSRNTRTTTPVVSNLKAERLRSTINYGVERRGPTMPRIEYCKVRRSGGATARHAMLFTMVVHELTNAQYARRLRKVE